MSKIEDYKKVQLKNNLKWELQGYSKAGEKTGFIIYPLKICLDAGVGTNKKPNLVCITHCHPDHFKNIHDTVHKNNFIHDGTHILVPYESRELTTNYIKHYINLSRTKITTTDISKIWKLNYCKPIFTNPYSEYKFGHLTGLTIKTYKAYHDTQSIGYGFFMKKRKLNNKYSKLNQIELVNLKKSSIEITEEFLEPQLVFYCDSTIDNLKKHSEWQKFPVVICECTGFPETHTLEYIKNYSHTHLNELIPIMKQFKNKQWILIHTSLKIENSKLDIIENNLRNNGINVTFWKNEKI